MVLIATAKVHLGERFMKVKRLMPLLICALALSVTACEKKGPLEKAGEKVDHVGDTIKNGGSEPMSDKLQDEKDKAVDKVNDAAGK
jgi:predicted small lipoprotein YifL